ncbi:hypothetical protein [Chenggangzhangella methanolivorans]|uniref:hypothetical protein n=1 Tax=Chenggangzhangella methanolivorans TaxID=1437009 RepID=UPI0021BD6531|nr:hypothetical protein [Chenggangzhangella methanolivorans]
MMASAPLIEAATTQALEMSLARSSVRSTTNSAKNTPVAARNTPTIVHMMVFGWS